MQSSLCNWDLACAARGVMPGVCAMVIRASYNCRLHSDSDQRYGRTEHVNLETYR